MTCRTPEILHTNRRRLLANLGLFGFVYGSAGGVNHGRILRPLQPRSASGYGRPIAEARFRMPASDTIIPIVSLLIAFSTVVVTALLMHRQAREMAHERNALALLEAIDRLTSPELVQAFEQLRDVNSRYSSDDDFLAHYPGSADYKANLIVGQFMETVACLARREVLDASLIVDAVGHMIRTRWALLADFIRRRRRLENNEYLYENFEWLARYSDWWKDIPRPRHPNYSPTQFTK